MNWFDALIMIAVIALLGVVYYFLRRLYQNKDGAAPKKGKDLTAAAAVAKPLAAAKRFAALQQYEVIAPAHLAKNGRFADLDFILVGCFGLLCVKCIGLGGEIYGDAADAKWLQIQNSERISLDNPLQTANTDTRLVRDALFAAKLKSVPVETVCVFTNKKAQLALPRNTGHYTEKEFKALLGKDKLLLDKKVDIAAAAAAVRAYLAPQA